MPEEFQSWCPARKSRPSLHTLLRRHVVRSRLHGLPINTTHVLVLPLRQQIQLQTKCDSSAKAIKTTWTWELGWLWKAWERTCAMHFVYILKVENWHAGFASLFGNHALEWVEMWFLYTMPKWIQRLTGWYKIPIFFVKKLIFFPATAACLDE